MEIKKLKLDDKEVEFIIEDDINAYELNELPEDLEKTQPLILEELRKQTLEDTQVLFKGDE